MHARDRCPARRNPALLAMTLAMAACASSPMPPPLPPLPVRIAPAQAPASPPLAASATPIERPSERPSERPARAATATPSGGPPLPVPPPRSTGVAARFPEPATTFATPAFAPGRQSFTDSDELRAILYGLERSGGAGRRTDVKVLDLGASQGGQPIEAISFTRPPVPETSAPSPAASVPAGPLPTRRPTVLLVAGQHGDEPAGTEALLVVAQDLAAGRFEAVLDSVDVVILARANPDGAAVFQRGAADGSDVNRDHLLLRTPEAQAQARLQIDFAPVVVVDLHEYPVGGAFDRKFGAVQRADVLLQYATTANLPPFVTKAAEEWFRLPLITSLRGVGLNADWYATTSADPAARRLSMGGVGPQIGRNAAGLRNAVSLLVETRGGGLGRTDFGRRVQAQVAAVTSVLGNAALHAADLVKLRQFVDRDTAAKACRGEAVVEAAPTASEYALSVLDADSGAVRVVNVGWDSALELRALKSRPRPCGYWLAADQTDAVRRLRLLGIEVSQLEESAELRGESYREIARQPISGDPARQVGEGTRVVVQLVPSLLDVAAGGYYVSLAQPLANLALAALEPETPAGFAANRVITSVASEARILQRPDTRMINVP